MSLCWLDSGLTWTLSDSCIHIAAGAAVIWRLDWAGHPTWLTHKAAYMGCRLGARLGCWLELLYKASPCTWLSQNLEAGLLEGVAPVSIPRGPGRSWEVSYDLVLEVSEDHYCAFCCPANHQGQPTSKVRETDSTSRCGAASNGGEGRNWWSSLEIISHIHQSPQCMEPRLVSS